MAGNVRHTDLISRRARARLAGRRQPHWQALLRGRAHLGYQRWPDEPVGRWLLRRYLGRHRYTTPTLGVADDAGVGGGLAHAAAEAAARVLLDGSPAAGKLTVRQALTRYIEFKQGMGQPVADVVSRGSVHILPTLGERLVAELTAAELRTWLTTMAAAPAQGRPKGNKPRFKAVAVGDDAVRARRATANRVLTMLKAALNHSFDEGHVTTRDAWGRKLKPFHNVETARVRYLTVVQAQRLLKAADKNFRPLLRAALETGCRYSELARLEIVDFNATAGTLTIRKSKGGKPRHVVLTPEGVAFFKAHTAALSQTLMFGGGWAKSAQARPMRAACAKAGIVPAVSFHVLRHTWASLAVMQGVPLLVVARNLGHTDTRMVERHYGHLAPSFITEAIHAGAPRFGAR